jgi:hypothetical protein
MKKYWRLLVVAIIVLVVGISIAWMNHAAAQKIVAEMPGISVQYVNAEGQDTYIVPNKSGFYWESYNENTDQREWNTFGPNRFFYVQEILKKIPISGDTMTLSVSDQMLPDRTIMKRWPDSELTPGDAKANHSQGTNIEVQWDDTGNTIVTLEIPVEKGSLYAIWLYYGDAWVEYSFLVPAEDDIRYEHLGFVVSIDAAGTRELVLDPIEWVNQTDTQRIEELNLNPDEDFPSGFYIYNPTKETVSFRLTDQTKYMIIDPATGNTSIPVDKTSFYEHLYQSPTFRESIPFFISETGGVIDAIMEQYVP